MHRRHWGKPLSYQEDDLHVKKESIESTIPDGFLLLHEVPKYFGSTCAVVKPFFKVSYLIAEALADQRLDSEKKIGAEYDELTYETLADGKISLLPLEAIVYCFKPIGHVQEKLEAAKTSFLMMVSPVLVMLKTQL